MQMKDLLKRIYWWLYDRKTIPCNLYAKIQAKIIGEKCKFHRFCRLTPSTVIGNNCHFNGILIQGKGIVEIGDNFHSGKGVVLISSDHNYDSGRAVPYDDTYVTGNIVIEDNVWIGTNVIILRGVRLGEGCIIQAGSVVVSDIPACSIAGGHPARVFKMRDEEHYIKLKEDGKFY